jgi:hypothetical protein
LSTITHSVAAAATAHHIEVPAVLLPPHRVPTLLHQSTTKIWRRCGGDLRLCGPRGAPTWESTVLLQLETGAPPTMPNSTPGSKFYWSSSPASPSPEIVVLLPRSPSSA